MKKEKQEIYRLLQSKGMTLSSITYADTIIDKENEHNNFIDSILLCQNCPLCSEEKIIGTGPITSPLMIVGSATSNLDKEQSHIFTNSAGYLLTAILNSYGVDRRSVYLTNAVKCRTIKKVTPNSICACRSFLEYEINLVKPEVIICLGDVATKSVLSHMEFNIQDIRGKIFSKNNIRIYPTWHPSYVLTQSGKSFIETRNQFINDIKNAIIYIKNRYPNYKWIL